MKNYRKEMLNHLKDYKKVNFPNTQNGTFKNIKYEYILPKEEKYLNLIETYKDDIIKNKSFKKIKPHTYFNHLNSSQAMCFNFFFPLYIEEKLELVTNFLGIENEEVNYDSVCFEKNGIENFKNNNVRRPTNFDFYFETKSKKKIYFEIKYTENGFGKGYDKDGKLEEKFNNVYSRLLSPLNETFHSEKKFIENYQICRNLIHITDKNSFVVFIYPKNNERINKDTVKAKEILKNEFKDNLISETWENLFKSINSSVTEDELKKQLAQFENKYFLTNKL